MELLFISRDALASSLTGIILAAIAARKAGRAVGILFTQEALRAVTQGFYRWPEELRGQEVRWQLADAAKEMGLPILGRGEGRQLDVRGLLELARQEGVALYACPIWTRLLGLSVAPPLEKVSENELLSWLAGPTRILGTL